MATTPITTISAGQVRNKLGDIINRAVYGGEQFLVERAGKPVIKIEPVAGEERQTARNRLFALHDKLAQRLAGVDQDELMRVIDDAVQEVRAKQRSTS